MRIDIHSTPKRKSLSLFLSALILGAVSSGLAHAKDLNSKPRVAKDGTSRVPAFDIPLSNFLSAQARTILTEDVINQNKATGPWWLKRPLKQCWPEHEDAFENKSIDAIRKCYESAMLGPLIKKQKARYATAIKSEIRDGVYTEIITPLDGVSKKNTDRLLINLHGGGFAYWARLGGQVESIPIAALGKIKVVSVDYRMWPEHKYPAGITDVIAVYKAYLAEYKPENIGIYGCSAGGKLTAQLMGWLQKEAIPLPGAIGMFCNAAAWPTEGESYYTASAIQGEPLKQEFSINDHPYFSDVNPDDPLVLPIKSPTILAKFPPSLLITSTRDEAMSDVIHTHAQLIKQGVEANLHVWDGLEHGFFYDPEFPESQEAYDVIVSFFQKYLSGSK